MLAPSPLHQIGAGFSWQPEPRHELHLAYGYFIPSSYQGPSATALLGIGGTERIEAHVHSVMLGWSWKH